MRSERVVVRYSFSKVFTSFCVSRMFSVPMSGSSLCSCCHFVMFATGISHNLQLEPDKEGFNTLDVSLCCNDVFR